MYFCVFILRIKKRGRSLFFYFKFFSSFSVLSALIASLVTELFFHQAAILAATTKIFEISSYKFWPEIFCENLTPAKKSGCRIESSSCSNEPTLTGKPFEESDFKGSLSFE